MPAPGTLLGVIAIIIALGGSAYAINLARNSVKSKHIAKNAVKGKDAKESTFGRVPSAARAATATNATNATNAANAGQVDGHDAVCPAETFLHAGVCFDNDVRFPMTSFGYDFCEQVGGYLPTVAQLHSIREVDGVNLGPDGDGHWADATWDDDNVEEAMTVDDGGDREPAAVNAFNQMRCAFPLLD